MTDFSTLHTFVICAYKDNPYLEECIFSLTQQSVKSSIILYTSTPTARQQELATKYSLEYIIKSGGQGIHYDWNQALNSARTPYCTLVHQDDIYLPQYAEKMITVMQKYPDAVIGFTDYADLCNDGKTKFWRGYLVVKRIMLAPFYVKKFIRSKSIVLNVLRFGNPICCPSVTYNLRIIKEIRFDSTFTVNLDWIMWINLARQFGSFLFLKNCLLYHRISPDMETAAALADNRRRDEDLRIFNMMFPLPLSRLIHKVYTLSYRSNRS